MLKLLNIYRLSRDLRDAKRLVAHARKHPMSLCLLSPDELLIYDEARMIAY